MTVNKKHLRVIRLQIPKDENAKWIQISRRMVISKEQLMQSVLRRHLKSRYPIPRKEWPFVFGKAGK